MYMLKVMHAIQLDSNPGSFHFLLYARSVPVPRVISVSPYLALSQKRHQRLTNSYRRVQITVILEIKQYQKYEQAIGTTERRGCYSLARVFYNVLVSSLVKARAGVEWVDGIIIIMCFCSIILPCLYITRLLLLYSIFFSKAIFYDMTFGDIQLKTFHYLELIWNLHYSGL